VADDETPSGSPDQVPAAPDVATPKVTQKALALAGAREMLGLGYSPDQVITWLEHTGTHPDGKPKTWVCGRTAARTALNGALETLDGEVAAPKNRKQARTRAMLTMMFQRAAKLAMDDTNKSKAAQLITAAVAAADKIARIDGAYAYDGSLLLPTGIEPASAEEAARIVAHAQATIELAQRRKSLASSPVPPPVVDASAVEVDDDHGHDEIPPTPAGDAN
jgi:hypothetical protein